MIPDNFIYYRPENLAEAVEAYAFTEKDGLEPLYLAGGTEVTTFCRNGTIKPGALIDIKRIPVCSRFTEEGDDLIFGAALTLNEVAENGSYPLLSRAARIADHTVRNRLTLGGNIAGRLPYRETVLPLLLGNTRVRLIGPEGERVVSLAKIFSKRLRLKPGEILVQLLVPKAAAAQPWYYCREVRKTRVDYPLVTACFLYVEGSLRMAVTGAYGFPLRDPAAETVLNDRAISLAEKPDRVIAEIPSEILEDMRSGAPYRRMLLKRAITKALQKMALMEKRK